MRKEDKQISWVKVVCIAAGVAAVVIGALVVLYKFFKKHFKITFDGSDCDLCGESCFVDDDFDCVPDFGGDSEVTASDAE